MLAFDDSLCRLGQVGPAIRVGKDLAQFLDPLEHRHPGVLRIMIAGQNKLRGIAGATYRRGRLFRVNGIAQT